MNLKRLLALLRWKPEPHCSKYADIDEVVGGKLRQAAQVNASATTLYRNAAKEHAQAAREVADLAETAIARIEEARRKAEKKAGKR
jgi:hypothetical protein